MAYRYCRYRDTRIARATSREGPPGKSRYVSTPLDNSYRRYYERTRGQRGAASRAANITRREDRCARFARDSTSACALARNAAARRRARTHACLTRAYCNDDDDDDVLLPSSMPLVRGLAARSRSLRGPTLRPRQKIGRTIGPRSKAAGGTCTARVPTLSRPLSVLPYSMQSVAP